MRSAGSRLLVYLLNSPRAVACGFRKVTTEFVPYLTFAASPSSKTLHSLRVGHYVLKGVAEKAREVEARDSRFKESEKDAQAARVATTMLSFEEDRRLKREKDARGALSSTGFAGRELMGVGGQTRLFERRARRGRRTRSLLSLRWSTRTRIRTPWLEEGRTLARWMSTRN